MVVHGGETKRVEHGLAVYHRVPCVLPRAPACTTVDHRVPSSTSVFERLFYWQIARALLAELAAPCWPKLLLVGDGEPEREGEREAVEDGGPFVRLTT